MKVFTLFIGFFVIIQSLGADDVLVSLGSIHSQKYAETSGHEYNNFNFGMGYRHGFTDNLSLAGGYYDNSYDLDTFYLAGEVKSESYYGVNVGFFAGGVTGYPRSEVEYKGWAPMMGVEIGYEIADGISAVIMATDTHSFDVPDPVGVAHLQLRFRF